MPKRPSFPQEADLRRAPALPIRAVAAAAAPQVAPASTLAFRALKAQAGKARPPLVDAPLIERVVESVGRRPGTRRSCRPSRRRTRARRASRRSARWRSAGPRPSAPRRRDQKAPAAAVRGHPPDGARRRHAARALGLPAPGGRPDGRRRAVLLSRGPEGLKRARRPRRPRAPAGEPFVFVLRGGGAGQAPLYGVCARETFGRPLRDAATRCWRRCVCVLTKRPTDDDEW